MLLMIYLSPLTPCFDILFIKLRDVLEQKKMNLLKVLITGFFFSTVRNEFTPGKLERSIL